MNKQPIVSVVIPTYNRASTIERSVRSVLRQSFTDLEVIVVDDCSTDATESIIRSIKDNKIRYKKLKKNMGGNYARNFGVSLAKGKYIAFQDSDDEWDSEKIEKQIEAIKDADYCFCRFIKFKNGKSEVVPAESFQIPSDRSEAFKTLFNGNQISTQTLLMKRELFDDISFDESLPRFQDWDFAIRLARKYAGAFIGEPLVKVYEQKDSISKNNKKALHAFAIMEEKYSNYFKEDKMLEYLFKKAECMILWHIGEDPKRKAREVLGTRFNLKIFGVLILSSFGVRGK